MSDQSIGRKLGIFSQKGSCNWNRHWTFKQPVSLAIFFLEFERIFSSPRFDRVFVTAITLGLSPGIISEFGNEARRHIYCIVGLVAAGLASSSQYFAVVLATAMAFLLSALSMRFSMLFPKIAIYPIEGVAQSVIVWTCLALLSKQLARKVVK